MIYKSFLGEKRRNKNIPEKKERKNFLVIHLVTLGISSGCLKYLEFITSVQIKSTLIETTSQNLHFIPCYWIIYKTLSFVVILVQLFILQIVDNCRVY